MDRCCGSPCLSIPILEDTTTGLPHLEAPHLEAKWLASLQFLHSVGGTIELGENNSVPLQREHDQFLMDYVLFSGKFKPAQIRRLNYYRMY
jgi:hypothetical protein